MEMGKKKRERLSAARGDLGEGTWNETVLMDFTGSADFGA